MHVLKQRETKDILSAQHVSENSCLHEAKQTVRTAAVWGATSCFNFVVCFTTLSITDTAQGKMVGQWQ